MFEHLTDRIQKVFKNLRGQGKITEANIEEALQEVRLALLEADVNLETVKLFLEKVKVKALGRDVSLSLTPGQVMIKIVHEELIQLLTPKDKNTTKFKFAPAPPTLILLAGLQGTGRPDDPTTRRPYGLDSDSRATYASEIRSSGSSRPMEKRTAPGSMAPAASARSSSWRCVVVATWLATVCVPPRDVAS